MKKTDIKEAFPLGRCLVLIVGFVLVKNMALQLKGEIRKNAARINFEVAFFNYEFYYP